MISSKDIGWLAGLLEGEGCFYSRCSPTIQVYMTDEDIIRRAGALMGGNVRGPIFRETHKKARWSVAIHGQNAAAWMMTLYPVLGVRRQMAVRKALTLWKAQLIYRSDEWKAAIGNANRKAN